MACAENINIIFNVFPGVQYLAGLTFVCIHRFDFFVVLVQFSWFSEQTQTFMPLLD